MHFKGIRLGLEQHFFRYSPPNFLSFSNTSQIVKDILFLLAQNVPKFAKCAKISLKWIINVLIKIIAFPMPSFPV